MWRSVVREAAPYKKRILSIILLFALSSICEVGTAFCTSYIADTTLQYNAGKSGVFLALTASVIAVQVLTDMTAALLSRRLQGHVQCHLASRFVQAILSAPYRKINPADLLTSYTNDLPGGANYLAAEMITFLSNLLLFAAVMVSMLCLKPFYTSILILLVIGMIFIQIHASNPIGEYTGKAMGRLAIYNAQVLDCLQNIELISAYGMEDIMLGRCDKGLESFLDASRERLKCFTKVILTAKNTLYVPLVLTYFVCGYDVFTGGMTPGLFLAYTTLATHAVTWIRTLSGVISSMRESGGHLKRFENCVSDLITQTAAANGSENMLPPGEENKIVFDNVNFSFGGKVILDGANLCIHRGEKIAITGEIGAGKSTILKLLLGICEPQSGHVRVFGCDAGKAAGRHEIAYVAQDDFFLPASLQENIAFGSHSPCINPILVSEAAWCADIDTFVSQLPQKYGTPIGDNGENFSGGQRQRIALARALYCNPPILLLDEATSALDPPGEARVLGRLLAKECGKTIIFVTHSPAVAKLCDRVFMLRSGRITEFVPPPIPCGGQN